MKEQARARARQLAQEFARRGDATGWFEQLYTQAQGNEQAIHWADMEVNPNLVGWLDRRNCRGKESAPSWLDAGWVMMPRSWRAEALRWSPSTLLPRPSPDAGSGSLSHRSSTWLPMCSILPQTGKGALTLCWKPTRYKFCLLMCAAGR